MFIEPIQSMKAIESLSELKKAERTEEQTQLNGKVPFKSIFMDAIEDVKETNNQVNIDAEKLATGKSDNLHQYSIDITRAQVSLEMLVELRNRALEAYNEVMRMGI
ncbi:MAG: flagellar hook-basal body complex protein FliE [Eubacteriales bacterium]